MVALKVTSADGDAPSVALTPVILRCSRGAQASKDSGPELGPSPLLALPGIVSKLRKWAKGFEARFARTSG